MDKKNNLILIGFMGSGKTTIGEIVSSKLASYCLKDIDQEIETLEGRKILDIFQTDGEEYFRDLETSVLKDVIKHQNLIISTGGGIILSSENRSLIKSSGVVFWVYSSSENTYERIKDDKNRPLINTGVSREEVINTIETIMENRFEFYKETADLIINTDKFSEEECAEEIIAEYGRLHSLCSQIKQASLVD